MRINNFNGREIDGGDLRPICFQESVPTSGFDPFGAWRQSVATQNATHGAIVHLDAQIRQSIGDGVFTPVWIFLGQPHDEILYFRINSRPAHAAFGGILPRNLLAIPTTEGINRDNGLCHLESFTFQLVGNGRKVTAFVVYKTRPFLEQAFVD